MPRKKYQNKKYSFYNSKEPPEEGMVQLGKTWITKEQAKKYIGPEIYDPKEYTEICRLTKKRSPYFCAFIIDPLNEKGETHFIMCLYVKRNNNKVAHRHTLVKSDLLTWVNARQGIEKYDEPVWKEGFETEEKLKTFLKN